MPSACSSTFATRRIDSRSTTTICCGKRRRWRNSVEGVKRVEKSKGREPGTTGTIAAMSNAECLKNDEIQMTKYSRLAIQCASFAFRHQDFFPGAPGFGI